MRLSLDRALPALFVLAGAAFAARSADWPGTLAFVASLALYGSMRLLEREQASALESDRKRIADLSAQVSELAMVIGARNL